jgi:hypothetical protein
VIRAWAGFAALGAGLIHLALVIGSPPAAGLPLAIAGVAEFGWGVFAVARPHAPLPRVARLAVLAPLAAWIITLLTGVAPGLGVRILPMLVASLLDVVVSAGLSVLLRRGARAERPIAPARYLIALAAGAVVVIALAAPALAATEAGELAGIPAIPGGTHGH